MNNIIIILGLISTIVAFLVIAFVIIYTFVILGRYKAIKADDNFLGASVK